jgi:hypothetical protein
MSILTNQGWDSIENFIRVDKSFPSLGIRIIGYFPYHTAKISKRINTTNIFLSRNIFDQLEYNLSEQRVAIDNKVVYICSGCTKDGIIDLTLDPFALWLKDSWALIGIWGSVVNYDGSPLKKITKHQKSKTNG